MTSTGPAAHVLRGPALDHRPPDFDVPPGACDCHVHVFADPATFALAAERRYNPEQASTGQLRQHLGLLGLQRVVVVQPSPYGTDNACTLDAVGSLGDAARAIAVTPVQVDQRHLQRLHAGGVRGLRFNLQSSEFGSLDDAATAMRAVADRIAPFGWNLQIYCGLDAFDALHATLTSLPVPVVLDHFGGGLFASDARDPRLMRLLDAMARGKVYAKLSGAYLGPTTGPAVDLDHLIDLYLDAGSDRVLWGSNWPHPMPPVGTRRSLDGIEPLHQVDDGAALNTIARRAIARGVLDKLLVANPQRLFWND
ncbi:amidohydrolase family protein [soil metagenome]